MALDIKGKTALVTGGGSGICLALTKRLLASGCNVVVADIQLLDDAKALVHQGGDGPAKAVFQHTDVTDWTQLQAAFDRALHEFGRLDLVVPGAGVFEPAWTNFWEFNTPSTKDTPASSSYKCLDINITHPIRATQLAIDSFARQNLPGGVVCLIASIAAQATLLPVPLYCASKHAVAAFTRSMAMLEPGTNFRVNAVAPGVVKTPLWPQDRLEWIDEGKDTWVTTEEVVDAMLRCVTDPEMVGGTVLEVLAGRTRKVEGLSDPGPQGEGSTLEKIGNGFDDVFGEWGSAFRSDDARRPRTAVAV